ncbi:MAG: hypothetical protein DSM107014_13080 [Gomphosphaeria aponina SAG 52.96 = DSM 107014]|uniref:Uncharacterized protein n=1 Tax=Gomphosphaeria aponina SAG 52.96 = DSM 107014 TaxID=1521640 RepID=A0A941GWF1_9CHRO|nr:hypothetical protein [Gomphosphaeria aponina SAG 52.96 = DSM 107014]
MLGEEETAQTTWMSAIFNNSLEFVDLIAELVLVLQAEVERRTAMGDLVTAEII